MDWHGEGAHCRRRRRGGTWTSAPDRTPSADASRAPHPDRRRPPGEPGGAGGDPRAAGPRRWCMARSGEEALRAHPAAATSRSSCWTCRCRAWTASRPRGSSSSTRAAATSRSSSSPPSTATRRTCSGLLARRGRLPAQAVRPRHPALEGRGVRRALPQGREAQGAGAAAARARARGAGAQEPGALPPPARRHARVRVGRGRQRARQLLEPARARVLRARRRRDRRRVVLGVPAPGRPRRGARALGGGAARRRPLRTPGPHQARRRRQLPVAPRARRARARRARRHRRLDRVPPPTSTTRSAPRRRCARRSCCATTSCRSRRTSCARR